MEQQQQGVSIIRAAGLKKADLFSLSDPYFLCRIGSSGSSWAQKGFESEGLQFRGKTIQDCHDPGEIDVKHICYLCFESNYAPQKCHNCLSEWGAKFTFDPSEDIVAYKLASALSDQENVGAALAIPELELAIRVYGMVLIFY